ncbi:MAG: hypothetical protein ABIP75_08515 [Pyrinomonadaceae bacterium]
MLAIGIRRFGFVLLTIFAIFAFAVVNNAAWRYQDGQSKAIEGLRANLESRAKLLVELQVARKYRQVYRLMAPTDGNSEESFIRLNKSADKAGRFRLVRFKASGISVLEPGADWGLIQGCGEYDQNGKRVFFESQIEARMIDGKWCFTSLVVISTGFGSEGKTCIF